MEEKYTIEEQKKHRVDLVDALRSGNYIQAKSSLKVKDNFCCLGVACDISELSDWKKGFYEEKLYYHYYGENSELPEEVREYFGFINNCGEFINENGEKRNLAKLNDDGMTFSQIANIIESEPKEMFR